MRMGIILELFKKYESKSDNKKIKHVIKESDKTIEKAFNETYSEKDYCNESEDHFKD